MAETALGVRTGERESSSVGSHSFYCTDTATYKTSFSAQGQLPQGAHAGVCGASEALAPTVVTKPPGELCRNEKTRWMDSVAE